MYVTLPSLLLYCSSWRMGIGWEKGLPESGSGGVGVEVGEALCGATTTGGGGNGTPFTPFMSA